MWYAVDLLLFYLGCPPHPLAPTATSGTGDLGRYPGMYVLVLGVVVLNKKPAFGPV